MLFCVLLRDIQRILKQYTSCKTTFVLIKSLFFWIPLSALIPLHGESNFSYTSVYYFNDGCDPLALTLELWFHLPEHEQLALMLSLLSDFCIWWKSIACESHVSEKQQYSIHIQFTFTTNPFQKCNIRDDREDRIVKLHCCLWPKYTATKQLWNQMSTKNLCPSKGLHRMKYISSCIVVIEIISYLYL